ncbi:MAG: GNAT family N-acetyltransferase [Lachnospiraceae bacterium]|nr:GNAT family N-acetyltransferase [Lachnospiraceae bacterium]
MDVCVESERLKYRPIREEDTDMVLGWRNSEYVRDHFLYREYISQEEHLNWLKTRVYTGQVIQFIIEEKATKRPIGSVYFRDVDKDNRTAEYGIFIGEKSARGKGYGNETAMAMVDYFFNTLRFDRLLLRVLKNNIPAIRSYEKAGFRQTDMIIDESVKAPDHVSEEVIYMEINRNGIE